MNVSLVRRSTSSKNISISKAFFLAPLLLAQSEIFGRVGFAVQRFFLSNTLNTPLFD
jgi:hypothetical protein